jgi:hypothetical protein
MSLKETNSEVRIGEHLSDIFPSQNGLKQMTIVTANLSLKYAIRKVKENQDRLKLDTSASDDVNLLGENINNINCYKPVKTLVAK